MKLLGLLLLLLTASATNAQIGGKICIGATDSIYSKTLGEIRPFSVYVPDSETGTERYPTIYVLDGEDNFQSVVAIVKHLSTTGSCPAMIVVGISSIDRNRDFTPTHFVDPQNTNGTTNSGGGELFTTFLEKELIPHIESKYKTSPFRMFIGHSFGGLMVINTLVKHTSLFNAYVAIDPSMWWDNKKLLNESSTTLSSTTYPGKTLYLAIANTMEKGMDTVAVKKDSTFSTAQIRSALELKRYLTSNKQNQLRSKQKYYDDESHPTIPLIAEYDAIRFIFDCYKFNFYMSDLDENADVAKRLDVRLDTHYKEASKQLGYIISPPEEMVGSIGNSLLERGINTDLAGRLLKMNTLYYPKSFDANSSLGDYYAAIGHKVNAIQMYKKALTINDSPQVRQKLENLQTKQIK